MTACEFPSNVESRPWRIVRFAGLDREGRVVGHLLGPFHRGRPSGWSCGTTRFARPETLDVGGLEDPAEHHDLARLVPTDEARAEARSRRSPERLRAGSAARSAPFSEAMIMSHPSAMSMP